MSATKPLYHDEFATLYCGDALDILPSLSRGRADLLVTDPPYGVSWQSRHRANVFPLIEGDHSVDVARAILSEALPVLRNRRHLYVFGPESIVTGFPVGATAELIWDRMTKGSGDLTVAWGPQHDRITFATHVSDGKKARETSGRLSARLRRGSVIAVRRPHGGGANHPTQKPVALMRQLIESSSLPGEFVLDPCAGTGATGVAAVLSGRRAVLIELDPTYAGHAATRLAEAARVRRLMDAM